jgi:hypothetical protein
MSAVKNPRVYFFCRPERDCYQEDVIILAQGLRTLGIPFSANCNYWQDTPGGPFLLQQDPDIHPDDADVVVVGYTYPYWIRMRTFEEVSQGLPAGLFAKNRPYVTVYMDNHDGHRTISWDLEYRSFDLILRSKLNRRAWHPSNMRPWITGFPEHIQISAKATVPFLERRRVILQNYGASHPYPHETRRRVHEIIEPLLRDWLPTDRSRDDLSQIPVDPYERLLWEQTGGRYSCAYFQRLANSQAVATFCGTLLPPTPFRHPERLLAGGRKATVRRAFHRALGLLDPRAERTVQWDSFRFWETLLHGCCAFQLDLNQHGALLPVMPEAGTHYVGIDLKHPRRALDPLRDDPLLMGKIAGNGHRWALEHYRPEIMARRFLEWAGKPVPSPSTT